MKTKLTTIILALTAGFAFGHGDIELGPNKGRILEFSTNETMHGEVTEKDGKLNIAVLDKDMKPVAIAAQELTATAGTRDKPVKMEITNTEAAFSNTGCARFVGQEVNQLPRFFRMFVIRSHTVAHGKRHCRFASRAFRELDHAPV